MNSELQEILKHHYGLSNTSIESLVGYSSTNFRITTPDAVYTLKKYSGDPGIREFIEAENRLLKFLSEGTNFYPYPVPSTNGDPLIIDPGNGDLYRLLTYLPGDHFPSGEQAPDLYHSLGRFLGTMNQKLAGYRDPVIEARSITWDLRNLLELKPWIPIIQDPSDRKIVEYFFLQHRERVVPFYPVLRMGVVHSDANELNLLVAEGRVTGIIDFGDTVYSHIINEAAIAITYAILDKEDPLAVASEILSGYHSVMPLEEDEIRCLYYLIAGRLCASLCHSSYSRSVSPENEYLTVSEEPVRRMLHQWISVSPVKALDTFREVCGLPTVQRATTEEVLSQRDQFISKSLSVSYRKPLKMEGAAFQYMYDSAGNVLLDAYNNIPHVGHTHPKVVEAGMRQMATLNTNTRYLYEQLPAYAEKLLATFPSRLNRLIMVNSGSEASDLAIRMARNFTGNKEVAVTRHGYHGHTSTGIEISHYKYARKGGGGKPRSIIELPLPGVFGGEYADHPDPGSAFAEESIALIGSGSLAAFITEPIVGCGGQVPLAPGYLQALYPAIRKSGGVCISDEVQTGFGRLGSWFWGFEMHGVEPDIVVLGKPMGNGHPVGAVVTTEEIARSFDNGMEFFSSFGGNPVSCAIALAVLEVIESELLQQNARETGEHWKSLLTGLMTSHQVIGDVRGEGLFLGVELVSTDDGSPATKYAADVKNAMREKHILVSTDGPSDNVLKMKPPLCFGKDDADRFVQELHEVLE